MLVTGSMPGLAHGLAQPTASYSFATLVWPATKVLGFVASDGGRLLLSSILGSGAVPVIVLNDDINTFEWVAGAIAKTIPKSLIGCGCGEVVVT